MSINIDSAILERLARLRENIAKIFHGRVEVIDQLMVGLLSGGHVLIEDVPGVGKTILARALAKSIQCSFARIQLTPDLLPSDIIGVSIYNEKTKTFEFKKGPIFANIVLADEVNRTTPRTQSAMLEAMNEGQISVDAKTFTLDRPFMVIATQNPFEFEGTYFLPENQLDRFTLRITIGYPSPEQEARVIMEQPAKTAMRDLEPVLSSQEVIDLQDAVDKIHVSAEVLDYVLRFITATRNHKHLDLGLSPRGGQTLMRAAQSRAMVEKRDYVIPEDIKRLAVPVCAHRVLSKSYLDENQTTTTASVITEIINEVAVPI
ncbi:MAG: MoxR family ATPase [Phycisphaerae bacterium]|nr:MoxR family ATPase [Phycisphaerae bacterium]